jgi:hypothetical protein
LYPSSKELNEGNGRICKKEYFNLFPTVLPKQGRLKLAFVVDKSLCMQSFQFPETRDNVLTTNNKVSFGVCNQAPFLLYDSKSFSTTTVATAIYMANKKGDYALSETKSLSYCLSVNSGTSLIWALCSASPRQPKVSFMPTYGKDNSFLVKLRPGHCLTLKADGSIGPDECNYANKYQWFSLSP